ncbi:helix-turn-helix domain-containing protein [Sphaerisporangium sp. B11E5]|uniref:AraC-like ligand-binding domain-containing protein n=1 Tax=Sphaerisporangium sp. B11E5 TaxID=3153563 RepID=UPI00325FABC6
MTTGHLPAAERFDFWREAAADMLIPSMLDSDHSDDFQARLRLLDLGDVRVSVLRYPPLETCRPASLVRRSDPEGYQFMLTLRGGHRLVHGGADVTSREGRFLLSDTSRPWQGWASGEDGVVEGIMVQVPRAVLPLPAGAVRRLTGVPLCGRTGFGALLGGCLRHMAAAARSLTPADGPHLAGLTVQLLTALCTHHLGRPARACPGTALFLRARAHIEAHLGDPGLTPATLAAACQVSVRHLHRLFRDQGVTVAAWVRHRRLESCRRDLADPALNHRYVHAIAARRGLPDPAAFSRAFRAAYGMSPRDYRRFAQEVVADGEQTVTLRVIDRAVNQG